MNHTPSFEYLKSVWSHTPPQAVATTHPIRHSYWPVFGSFDNDPSTDGIQTQQMPGSTSHTVTSTQSLVPISASKKPKPKLNVHALFTGNPSDTQLVESRPRLPPPLSNDIDEQPSNVATHFDPNARRRIPVRVSTPDGRPVLFKSALPLADQILDGQNTIPKVAPRKRWNVPIRLETKEQRDARLAKMKEEEIGEREREATKVEKYTPKERAENETAEKKEVHEKKERIHKDEIKSKTNAARNNALQDDAKPAAPTFTKITSQADIISTGIPDSQREELQAGSKLWDAETSILQSLEVASLDGSLNESKEIAYPTTQHSIFAPDAKVMITGNKTEEVQDMMSFLNVDTSNMSAQDMLNCLCDHGCSDLTLLVDLSQMSAISFAGGAFGDIFKGNLHDGRKIAVKMLRAHVVTDDVSPKWLKRIMREIYVWSKTNHANVQKLMGVAMLHGRLSMISLWMDNGNLQQYTRNFPDADRYEMCTQVATGLSYLHSIDMVHGDLKALNVLVSEDGVAKISDFDHSILSDCSLVFSTTTNKAGGTFRWMAPELVLYEDNDHGPPITRNKQTDVYALGMTILEVISGSVPYAEYRSDGPIYGALMKKQFPKRPEPLSSAHKRGDRVWSLLISCWDYKPSNRPTASSAREMLRQINKEAPDA